MLRSDSYKVLRRANHPNIVQVLRSSCLTTNWLLQLLEVLKSEKHSWLVFGDNLAYAAAVHLHY